MYCTKCGAKNDDGARFCVVCGAKQEGAISERAMLERPKAFNKGIAMKPVPEARRRRKIRVVPICVIVLLLLAVVMFPKVILSGNEEKKIIKKFVDAQANCDAEGFLSMIPEQIFDKIYEEDGMSKIQFQSYIEKELKSAMQTVQDTVGEDWTISYEILDIKELTGEDFDDVKYDYIDELDLVINAAKTAEVELFVKAKDTESSRVLDIGLVDIDGTWYLDFMNMSI